MTRILFAAFLCTLSATCIAQTACPKVADDKAHICWAGVTTFTNGQPIPVTSPITYTVQRQTGTTWTNDGTTTANDWTSPVLAPGTYVYRVTATVGTKTSLPSATASRGVDAPTPEAPVIIVAATIRANGSPTYRVVYTVTPRAGEVVFVAPAALRRYLVSK